MFIHLVAFPLCLLSLPLTFLQLFLRRSLSAGSMTREDGAATLGLRLLTRSLQEPVRIRSRFSWRSSSNGNEASLRHKLLTRSLQDLIQLCSCVGAVRRADRHGIFRLLVAPMLDTSRNRMCFLEHNVTRGRSDCFFCFSGEFHDVMGSLFNIETSRNDTFHLHLKSSCQP